jgi:hypothetical protein
MTTEPVLILAFVAAVLDALIAVKVIDDSGKQVIMAIVGAGIPLVAAVIARHFVTPVAKDSISI